MPGSSPLAPAPSHPEPAQSQGDPRWVLPALGALLLLGTACGDTEEIPESSVAEEVDSPVEAYWDHLSIHCGEAFPGELTLEPEGDEMLEGDELLVVHFDVCEDDEIRLPFHIEQMDGEWDRSRTWIFRPHGASGIELRHDHRNPDGSEEETTWYGGFTRDPGEPTVQEFVVEQQYDEDDPEGPIRGWRVIVEPGERYVYGTISDGEWTWRVDFDLSEPMDEVPPPAWGYEDGGGPLR